MKVKAAVGRMISSVLVLFAVVACDSNKLAEPMEKVALKVQAIPEQRQTSEFRTEHNVDIKLSIEGELKPGGQNSLVARVQ